MYNLKFKLPERQKTRQEFFEFLAVVNKEKDNIRRSLSNGAPLVTNSRLEKHVKDDLAEVLRGIRRVPKFNHVEWDVWSFHRTEPRWGTPLFALMADETTDSVFLDLILSDDWTDEEAPVNSIRFRSIKTYKEFEDEFDAIMQSGGLNYWVKNEGDFLNVLLEPTAEYLSS